MIDQSLHARQEALESRSIERGVARYFEARAKDAERGRAFDNVAANGIVARTLNVLVPAVRILQDTADTKVKTAHTTGRRLGGWELQVCALDPATVAYVALKSAIASAGEEHRVQRLCMTIGRMLSLECQWAAVRRAENKAAKDRDQTPPNRVALMKMRVKQINPRSVTKWLKQMDDLEVRPWARRAQFQVGASVLNTLLETCPDVLWADDVVRKNGNKRITSKLIKLKPDFVARLSDTHDTLACTAPWLVPMVCPPRAWEAAGDTIRGGYLTMEQGMVKEARYRHTTLDGVSDEVLRAVNLVQNTKWRINEAMLQEATCAADVEFGPLPYEPDLEMPDNLSSEEWDKASNDEKGRIKSTREAVHNHNNRMRAKRTAAVRVLTVAKDFVKEECIYFPHTIDWRGRMYPLPQDLHPQADDFTKALLEFAEGKALGARGLKWLMYHTANSYGVDKVSRDEQEKWCWDNLDNIHMLATCGPSLVNLTGEEQAPALEAFWSAADKPWQFMAACKGLSGAMLMKCPEEHVSHLPVSIDGSCNGLQHLSAMGLDPTGGDAVNLTGGERRDIYTIVSERVQHKVDSDVLMGALGETKIPEAWAWKDNVTRKVVKRGVMTTPYGLTDMGMRTQLLKGGFVNSLPGDRLKNANYMRDAMKAAIAGTIVVGTQIMSWFQDCAEILVDEGKAIEWTTPMGLRVKQSYLQPPSVTVRTLCGHITFVDPDGDQVAKMKRTKQIQSIAPNIIHSFDAAHLMMTVLTTAEENLSYAMVHDSYGCHAADVDFLSYCTRKSFVDIYSVDWFDELYADFSTQRGAAVVPPPVRGTFDINEVLNSEYFFA
jgi:DNA-directed RNA polymerase